MLLRKLLSKIGVCKMAIYFSEKFKNLRKSRELTQEEIANIFHVSPQAVSRWETGVTYPDIELLPSLADFFEITVDNLLGIDVKKKEERLEEIINQISDARTKQAVDENAIDQELEIIQNGLVEFPNNLYLLDALASSFWNKAAQYKDNGQICEMKKYAEETIKIYERLASENKNYTTMPILEKYGCRYDSVRYSAIQGMAYTYHVIGEPEKAIEWAKKLPNLNCTEQMVLQRILKDEKSEERVKQLQWNIYEYSGELKYQLGLLSQYKYDFKDIPDEIERFKENIAEFEKYARSEVGFT